MAPAPSGTAVLATHFTLLGIALALILARVWLRLRIQKNGLLVSDILVMLAWAAGCATASFDVVFKTYGVLEPDIDYSLRNWAPPDVETLEHILEMIWISTIPFFSALYLCKASLLAVCLQLCPTHMKIQRMTLWAIIGYCIAAFLASMATHLFICMPIAGNWAVVTQSEIACPDATPATVFRVAWALHIIGSILIFAFPFSLIYKVQLRPKMKIGVYAVLMLGLIDIAFSITRFASVELGVQGDFISLTLISLWSCLDVNVGIIVACLPALRPYLRRDMKSSSAGYTYGTSSNMPSRLTNIRRPEINGFEVIDEGSTKSGQRPGIHGASSDGLGTDEGWNDKKSNRSDIELVDVPPRMVV